MVWIFSQIQIWVKEALKDVANENESKYAS